MGSITWKPNANGYWTVGANWSGGVEPGALDNVTLSSKAAHKIYFNTNDTVASLISTDDLLVLQGGTLGVSGLLNLAGGSLETSGVLSLGAGSDTISGGVSISAAEIALASTTTLSLGGAVTFGAANAAGAQFDGAGTLNTAGATSVIYNNGNVADEFGGGLVWSNAGTVTQTGQIEAFFTPGVAFTLNNLACGVFDFTGGEIVNGTVYNNQGVGQTATSVFNNAGTLENTGGSTSDIYSAVNSTGTIDVVSGELALENGGTLAGTIEGAGVLDLAAGVFTLSSSLATQTGFTVQGATVAIEGGVNIAGGFTLNGSIALDGGTLTVASPTLIYGVVNGPGTFVTTGATNFTNIDNSFFIGGNAEWINTGTVTQQTYYLNEGDGSGTGIVLNQSGAVYDFENNYGISNNGPTPGTFINAGLLEKTGGGGATSILVSVTNTGTIDSAVGVLQFGGGGTFAGSLIGAGTIGFSGGVDTLTAGATFAAAGLLVDGGTLELGASLTPTNFAISGGTLELAGNTLGVSGASLTGGHIDGPGTLAAAGTTTLHYGYLGGGAELLNIGVVDQTGYIYGSDASGIGIILNQSGATFALFSNSEIYSDGSSGTFINAGLLERTGAGTTVIQDFIDNTGMISVAAGSILQFESGGTFGGAVIGAGTIGFDGGTDVLEPSTTLSVANLLVESGTLELGNSVNETGHFFQTGGTLELDGYTLAVTGAAISGGEIDGPGTFETGGTTALGSFIIGGGAEWINSGVVNGTANQIYGADASGPGIILNETGAIFDFTSDFGIYNNVNSGTFINAGLLEAKAGTSYLDVQDTVDSTGTIDAVSGSIDFTAGGTFGGTIIGSGIVYFGGAPIDFGNLSVSSATILQLAQAVTLTGSVTISDSLTYYNNGSNEVFELNGNTLTLTGNNTFGSAGGALASFDGPGALITSGTTTVQNYYTNDELLFSGGAVWDNVGKLLDSGVIQLGSFDGPASISNTGTFDLTTDTAAVAAGFSYDIYGDQIPVIGTITNAGTFAKTGGTSTNTVNATFINTGTIQINAGTLAFEDGGTLGGLVSASAHINLAGGDFFVGAFTDNGLLADNAQIDQTGVVTLGAGTPLSISGIYDIDNNSSIVLGSTSATTIALASAGVFAKIGGAGVSTIAGNFADAGTIIAQVGQLDFAGTVSGAGSATIATGAALEFGGSVGSSIVVTLGVSSELLLDQPGLFKGKISNFVPGGTLDLGGLTVTSATGSSTGVLTLKNGTVTVGTLSLVGNHTGDAYTYTADGRGGTLLGISSNNSSWIGATADWSTASDWSAGVPTSGTNATIAGTTAKTITIGAAESEAVKSLTLSNSKAILAIDGTLGIGTTFVQSAGTTELAGTINNGTINVTGGDFASTDDSATFYGVAYEGALDLSQSGAQITVLGGSFAGANGTGVSSMNIIGADAGLFEEGIYTLYNAAIFLGNNSGPAYIEAYDPNDTGALFTLGTSVSVVQSGLYANIGDNSGNDTDGMFSSAAITAAVSGGTFTAEGNLFENDGVITVSNGDEFAITAANFTNAGTLNITGSTLYLGNTNFTNTGSFALTNSTLNVGGSFSTGQIVSLIATGDTLDISGTLNNTGAVLATGSGTTLGTVTLAPGGNIIGGTISDAGGGINFVPDAPAFESGGQTLSSVTYEGTLNVNQSGENVYIANGITLTGAGGIGPGYLNFAGPDSNVEILTSTMLDNATIAMGAAVNNVQLDDSILINNNSGSGLTLTLGPKLLVIDNVAQSYANFGDVYGTSNDLVLNEGVISAAASGATFFFSGSPLTNQGILQAINGGTIDLSGTLQSFPGLTNLTGTTLTGGTYSVGASSVIELAKNAKITTDAADIILSGTASNIQGLSGSSQIKLDSTLASIASGGTLSLLAGRNFAGTQAFTDAGVLNLGGTTFSAASFTVASTGMLNGFGSVTNTVVNNGVIAALPGGTLKLAGVTGAGSLLIGAGDKLEVAGAAAAAETVTFGGGGATLLIDNAAAFAATLGNFAAGDVLDFTSLAGAAAVVNGTTLSVTSGGTLYTETINSLAAGTTLVASADGHGGTDFTGYRQAAASLHSPEPVAFGQVHVGDTLVQALTISNISAPDGFSESLDGSFASAGTGVFANGSFSLLAPGSTNTALSVTLATGGPGAETGTAIITLASDGSGTDGQGVTGLGTQTVNLSATVFAYATAQTAGTVSLGQAHVGATLAQALTLANSAASGIYSENLDAGFSGTSLGLTANGGVSELAAGTSSTALSVTLAPGAAGVDTGGATIALVSDGTGIDTLASTTLAPQTVAVSGTFFNYATAAGAPSSVSLGQGHVGAVDSRLITISNAAAPGLYSENLDASFSGTSPGLSAGGALTELAAGGGGTLTIAVSAAPAGLLTGATTLNLTSDGAGIDTLGTNGLGADTIAISGTLFNYATAVTAPSVNLGQHHAGFAYTQVVTIANAASPGLYSENLDASFSGTSSAFSGTGSVSELTAGGTNGTGLTLTMHSASGGLVTGAATLKLSSDGSGIDALGTTALAAQTIAATGTLFNYATASLTSKTINFGIVHVGQTVSQYVTLANSATTGKYSEGLDASFSGTSSKLTTTGTLSHLAAGSTSKASLDIVLNTGAAGTVAAGTTLKLTSDGSGIDSLGTTALTSQTVTVTGTVNNYATAALENVAGAGTLTGSGTTLSLNLGSVAAGGTLAETIGVLNSATGPADVLGGSFAIGAVAGFTNSGFGTFSGITAGNADTTLGISLSDLTAGTYSETIVLNAAGSNASGYSGTLAAETLVVTGTVTSNAQVKPAASWQPVAGTVDVPSSTVGPARMSFLTPAASAAASATASATVISWHPDTALQLAGLTPSAGPFAGKQIQAGLAPDQQIQLASIGHGGVLLNTFASFGDPQPWEHSVKAAL